MNTMILREKGGYLLQEARSTSTALFWRPQVKQGVLCKVYYHKIAMLCLAGLLAAGLLGLLALLAFAPRSSSTSDSGYGGWVPHLMLRWLYTNIDTSYGSQRTSQDYDYYGEGDDFGRRRSGPELVDGEYSEQNVKTTFVMSSLSNLYLQFWLCVRNSVQCPTP